MPNKTARVVGPKRIIAHQGSKRDFAEEGFAKRARAEGGEAVVLDVEKAGMAGKSWTWSRLVRMVSHSPPSVSCSVMVLVEEIDGRLVCLTFVQRSTFFFTQPLGELHRPTTPPGSKTGLRFSSELTIEVYYGLSSDREDGAVRVVPLFQKKIELASYAESPLRLIK
jgi:hypothetical protein